MPMIFFFESIVGRRGRPVFNFIRPFRPSHLVLFGLFGKSIPLSSAVMLSRALKRPRCVKGVP